MVSLILELVLILSFALRELRLNVWAGAIAACSPVVVQINAAYLAAHLVAHLRVKTRGSWET